MDGFSSSSSRPQSRESSLSHDFPSRSSYATSLVSPVASPPAAATTFDDDEEDALPEPSVYVDSEAAQYGLTEAQTKAVHKLVKVRVLV